MTFEVVANEFTQLIIIFQSLDLFYLAERIEGVVIQIVDFFYMFVRGNDVW